MPPASPHAWFQATGARGSGRYAQYVPVRTALIEGDGSSHLVPIERADDFNQLVVRFLGG